MVRGLCTYFSCKGVHCCWLKSCNYCLLLSNKERCKTLVYALCNTKNYTRPWLYWQYHYSCIRSKRQFPPKSLPISYNDSKSCFMVTIKYFDISPHISCSLQYINKYTRIKNVKNIPAQLWGYMRDGSITPLILSLGTKVEESCHVHIPTLTPVGRELLCAWNRIYELQSRYGQFSLPEIVLRFFVQQPIA
jgi:hypothetical protein